MEIDVIYRISKGKTDVMDTIEILYEICDNVHSSCGIECPVYELNGGPVNPHRPFRENRGCDCFKNGSKMFAFIKEKLQWK
jgi:hypothetical protein